MHRTNKYLALVLGLIVSAEILVFAWRDSRRPKTGFNVQVASPRIVMLHIAHAGALAINSELVSDGQLAGRLREIYGTGAEGFLYLFPENDTPAQRIADVIDVIQRLHSENMNIQVRLVTSGALYSAVSARSAR
jgi:biopolymer transport protein ExbD